MGQVIQLLDSYTKENVTYEEITTWHDGSPMDDTKVDNVIFRKKGYKYYVDCDYLSGNPINIKRFGAKGDGVTDDSPFVQKALSLCRNITFGSRGTFYLATPIGIPQQDLYSAQSYKISASGAFIMLGGTEAIFTSQNSLANPESTSNLYTAKITFSGLDVRSKVVSESSFVNGDRLYNVFVTNCTFKYCASIVKSFRNKGTDYPNGYIQSITIHNNHFSNNNRIIDAYRSFNFRFTENMCESNNGGIYIVGPGQPSNTSLIIKDNLFEGGGVFAKLSSVYAGVISGNYLEANDKDEAATLKCHIYLLANGGAHATNSGLKIDSNMFAATTAQIIDTGWVDVKVLRPDDASVNISAPILSGNWSNSYCMATSNNTYDGGGNTATNATTLTRASFVGKAENNKTDFKISRRTIDNPTSTYSGNKAILSFSYAGSVGLDRMFSALINLNIRHKTAPGAIVGHSFALIHLAITPNRLEATPNDASIVVKLVSLIHQPAGESLNNTLPDIKSLCFWNPTTTPNIVVTKNSTDKIVDIALSGYRYLGFNNDGSTASGVPNLGPAYSIEVFGVIQANTYNGTNRKVIPITI